MRLRNRCNRKETPLAIDSQVRGPEVPKGIDKANRTRLKLTVVDTWFPAENGSVLGSRNTPQNGTGTKFRFARHGHPGRSKGRKVSYRKEIRTRNSQRESKFVMAGGTRGRRPRQGRRWVEHDANRRTRPKPAIDVPLIDN